MPNSSEDIYRNIADHLPGKSFLIFNDTKVIKARILFEKLTGAVIEIFCLEPYEEINDYAVVLQQKNSTKWKCLIGGAGKWKEKYLEKIKDRREVVEQSYQFRKLAEENTPESKWWGVAVQRYKNYFLSDYDFRGKRFLHKVARRILPARTFIYPHYRLYGGPGSTFCALSAEANSWRS